MMTSAPERVYGGSSVDDKRRVKLIKVRVRVNCEEKRDNKVVRCPFAEDIGAGFLAHALRL